MITDEALEALVVGNPDFEELERTRGVFCPFEAIGMVRQEIRHAHFLHYCLDPQRPHGFGTEPLRAILRAAAIAQRESATGDEGRILSPLDVHLMQFEAAEIRREWRRIDLLAVIQEEKLIAAIELKIEAGEHSGQLGRYRDLVERQWPTRDGWRHLFLFLTCNGDQPSEDGAGWLPLSLAAVAGEFDGIVRRQVGAPEARATLTAWLAMLRRHFLTDQDLVDLAGRLWAQHREALDFLMEHRPDVEDGIAGLLLERQDEICRRLAEACGMAIEIDSATPRRIRFAVLDWDNLPDFRTASGWTSSGRLLLLELWRDGNGNGGIRFELGPGAPATRQRYFDALKAAGISLSNRKEITNRFTRIGSMSLPSRVDELADGSDQVELAVDRIIQKVIAYGAERIPAFCRALALLAE